MIVYATGEKARAQKSFVLAICPARHLEGAEMPAEWVTETNEPREMQVEFTYGRAEVPDNIGRYLLAHGLASKTTLILPHHFLVG
jgi:hypothetical protein